MHAKTILQLAYFRARSFKHTSTLPLAGDAMPVFTAADYAALSVGSLDLGLDDTVVFNFTFPNGFIPGTNLARPVLFYEVTPFFFVHLA